MAAKTLDLRGKVCPEPYLLALREFTKMPKGSQMVVVMDSWKCALLLVESVKSLGLGEAKLSEEGEQTYKIVLVKTSDKATSPLTSSC